MNILNRAFLRVMGTCLTALMLCSCRAEVVKEISFSELDRPLHSSTASLAIEVDSCTDFIDKSKPSALLLKLQEQIPGLFPGATFGECVTRNLAAMAEFTIPIKLGAVPLRQLEQYEEPVLWNFKDNFGIYMSDKFHKRYRQFIEALPLGPDEVSFKVVLTNDREPFTATATAVYVDGRPVVQEEIKVGAQPVTLELSKLALDSLTSAKRSAHQVVLLSDLATD